MMAEGSYDGSTLVHGRFVSRALELMMRERNPGDLHVDELMAILNFVDNYALSSGLYWDNTVPRSIASEFEAVLNHFCERFGISEFRVSPAPRAADEYMLCVRVLQNCSSQLKQVEPDALTPALDAPIPQASVNALDLVLSDRSALHDPADQELFARSLLGRELHGKKLLAGLTAPESESIFGRLHRLHSALSPEGRCSFWGVIFNVQGAHYLSSLAESVDSAYLVGLSSDWSHVLRFADHVWADFLRTAAASALSRSQAALVRLRKALECRAASDEPNAFSIAPPTALLALIDRRTRDPGDLLVHAYESVVNSRAGLSYRKQLWDAHAGTAEKQQAALRSLHLAAGLQLRAGKIDPNVARTAPSLILPAIWEVAWKQVAFAGASAVNPALSKIMAAAGATFGIYDVAGHAMRFIEAVRAATGRRGFINFYGATAQRLTLVQERDIRSAVRRVFGRNLVLSS